MFKWNSLCGAIRIFVAASFMLLAFTTGFLGCSSAGNAGTGASGEVKGDVHEISQRAQSVFKDMNIQLTSTDSKDYGHEQSLGGTSGDEKVTIQMTSSGPNTTHVEVTAKAGTLKWDKDYANEVLSRILQG